MENNEVKLHRLSKFKKLDPLLIDYSDRGNLRLVRWTPARVNCMADRNPNGIVMEDLPPGGIAIVEASLTGFYEVRAKKSALDEESQD